MEPIIHHHGHGCHGVPMPPVPPVHNHGVCHEGHDVDYMRLHELVMKLYRLYKALKERVDTGEYPSYDDDNEAGEGMEGGGGCKCVVDKELSKLSENAVQNKAVATALGIIEERVSNIEKNGGSGGAAGVVRSVFKQIFIQTNDRPFTPGGGSYDFNTNAFVAPDGWSTDARGFNSKDDVWMSYRTFLSDNTETEWSKPVKMIDYSSLADQIEKELEDLYDKLLQDAESELNKVLGNAEDQLDKAKEILRDAKDKLREAKDYLDHLKESWGNQGIDEETIGKIVAFANWYDVNAGTITSLSSELNAIKGSITTQGESIDTINETITAVRTQLSAVEGSITNEASRIDALNGTVSNVSSRLDATATKAETAATWVDTNKEIVNSAISSIDGYNAKINNAVNAANAANASATSVESRMDAIEGSLTQTVQTKVDEYVATGGIIITPEKIIQALTNTEGASAAIIQSINGSDSEVKIAADKILLNGETIAALLRTQRLVINNGNTVLEKDGSGYVANGNISWDKDGVIRIGNNAVEIGSTGELNDITYIVPERSEYETIDTGDLVTTITSDGSDSIVGVNINNILPWMIDIDNKYYYYREGGALYSTVKDAVDVDGKPTFAWVKKEIQHPLEVNYFKKCGSRGFLGHTESVNIKMWVFDGAEKWYEAPYDDEEGAFWPIYETDFYRSDDEGETWVKLDIQRPTNLHRNCGWQGMVNLVYFNGRYYLVTEQLDWTVPLHAYSRFITYYSTDLKHWTQLWTSEEDLKKYHDLFAYNVIVHDDAVLLHASDLSSGNPELKHYFLRKDFSLSEQYAADHHDARLIKRNGVYTWYCGSYLCKTRNFYTIEAEDKGIDIDEYAEIDDSFHVLFYSNSTNVKVMAYSVDGGKTFRKYPYPEIKVKDSEHSFQYVQGRDVFFRKTGGKTWLIVSDGWRSFRFEVHKVKKSVLDQFAGDKI